MGSRRSRWISLSLVLASCLLLAGPALLVRQWLRPIPWNALNFQVRYQSVRYERAGLVFTYRIDNRTARSERLLPGDAKLRVMQPPDQPVVGYPVMRLPLQIQAHQSREIEVRLELAVPREVLLPQASEDQTARVLQHTLPDASALDSPLSPLPMSKPAVPPRPPVRVSADRLLSNALLNLQGFELVDPDHGIRILFPRGW